jgi:hypothetical protein
MRRNPGHAGEGLCQRARRREVVRVRTPTARGA